MDTWLWALSRREAFDDNMISPNAWLKRFCGSNVFCELLKDAVDGPSSAVLFDLTKMLCDTLSDLVNLLHT